MAEAKKAQITRNCGGANRRIIISSLPLGSSPLYTIQARKERLRGATGGLEGGREVAGNTLIGVNFARSATPLRDSPIGALMSGSGCRTMEPSSSVERWPDGFEQRFRMMGDQNDLSPDGGSVCRIAGGRAAAAQSATPSSAKPETNCTTSSAATTGSAAEKTSNSMAVEKSAILPDAGGANSAAPTVQSGGKPMRNARRLPAGFQAEIAEVAADRLQSG